MKQNHLKTIFSTIDKLSIDEKFSSDLDHWSSIQYKKLLENSKILFKACNSTKKNSLKLN